MRRRTPSKRIRPRGVYAMHDVAKSATCPTNNYEPPPTILNLEERNPTISYENDEIGPWMQVEKNPNVGLHPKPFRVESPRPVVKEESRPRSMSQRRNVMNPPSTKIESANKVLTTPKVRRIQFTQILHSPRMESMHHSVHLESGTYEQLMNGICQNPHSLLNTQQNETSQMNFIGTRGEAQAETEQFDTHNQNGSHTLQLVHHLIRKKMNHAKIVALTLKSKQSTLFQRSKQLSSEEILSPIPKTQPTINTTHNLNSETSLFVKKLQCVESGENKFSPAFSIFRQSTNETTDKIIDQIPSRLRTKPGYIFNETYSKFLQMTKSQTRKPTFSPSKRPPVPEARNTNQIHRKVKSLAHKGSSNNNACDDSLIKAAVDAQMRLTFSSQLGGNKRPASNMSRTKTHFWDLMNGLPNSNSHHVQIPSSRFRLNPTSRNNFAFSPWKQLQ